VLERLAQKGTNKWNPEQAIGSLDLHDVQRIRALPEVKELGTFLEKVQRDEEAA
jgi:hypothetical protein